jgi:predicted phage tail protein
VKVYRISPDKPADEGMTTFVWSGLKLIANNSARAYGDVTLLAVRIKASRGVSGEGAVRVTARCFRYMHGLPNGEWQHSTNPADAFYDIYTNGNYGAGRPAAELDLAQLNALRAKWAGYQFNHVFKDNTTVWEALKTATVGLAAEPLPLGSVMSVAQDGVKPARSMLFTDANIVENSMKVNYIFDVEDTDDGIEVQYIDRVDWKEAFVRYPANSVVPQTVLLAGCTDGTHAAQYARLVWQRTRGQRKRITFDTELEGIILQLGDRIAISHEMPRWGDNGLVLSVTGNQVTVDHDLDWAGSGHYMMFRRADGAPSDLFPVTRGGQSNIAVLGSAINFTPHFDDDYDYTSFAFGTATTMVRDFTVATTRHSGDTVVSVEAVNYAPEIFDGAMTFLGGVR